MTSSIDLNLYRFLTTLYQWRTVDKTIHKLDISKATFNRHLSDCRDLFENELFIAEKGKYEPTAFMVNLHKEIEEPLNFLNDINGISTTLYAKKKKIELAFYLPTTLNEIFSLRLIEHALEQDPEAKLSFQDWALNDIESPKKNTLPVGITGYPQTVNHRVIDKKLGSLALFVYLPKNHPLANSSFVELKKLEHQSTVRITMGSIDTHRYYQRIFTETGIRLQQNLTVANTSIALACVAKGHHIFVSFDSSDLGLPTNVVKVPLKLDGKRMKFDLGMQYHRSYYQHPIITQIETVMKNVIKTDFPIKTI